MTKSESFFLLRKIAIDQYTYKVSLAKVNKATNTEAELRWEAHKQFGRDVSNFDAMSN
jgi:hypothetical protein